MYRTISFKNRSLRPITLIDLPKFIKENNFCEKNTFYYVSLEFEDVRYSISLNSDNSIANINLFAEIDQPIINLFSNISEEIKIFSEYNLECPVIIGNYDFISDFLSGIMFNKNACLNFSMDINEFINSEFCNGKIYLKFELNNYSSLDNHFLKKFVVCNEDRVNELENYNFVNEHNYYLQFNNYKKYLKIKRKLKEEASFDERYSMIKYDPNWNKWIDKYDSEIKQNEFANIFKNLIDFSRIHKIGLILTERINVIMNRKQ